MFESPTDRFIRRAWWLPWTMAIALPIGLPVRSAVSLPLATVLLVLTCVCWSLRRFEASLVACLCLPPLAAIGLLLPVGPPAISAAVGALLVTLPLAVLTALRPRLGLALALASFAVIALRAEPGQLQIVLFSFASTATLGLALAAFFKEVELGHGGLAGAALTDPITGSGNFYALKRDFQRHKAQADRDGSSLLFMRWYFGPEDCANRASSGLSTAEIANTLALNVRQGDSLYYLGDDEFVSLHQRLTTGAHMRERVLRVVSGAHVSWAKCERSTLVQALEEVRDSSWTRTVADTRLGAAPPS